MKAPAQTIRQIARKHLGECSRRLSDAVGCLRRARSLGTEAAAHGSFPRIALAALRALEVAQIEDRPRCTLGCDNEVLLIVARSPDLRHGEKIGPNAMGADERPAGSMKMLGPYEPLVPEFVECLLHRVGGLLDDGQNAELDEIMGRLWKRFDCGRPDNLAEPSVSMAAAHLVSTRAWEMRQAPVAMNTVSTTGNSAGSIDMPTAMPASTASRQLPRRSP